MVIKHKFFAQKIIIKLRTRAREFSLLRKIRRKETGRAAMVKMEPVEELEMKSILYLFYHLVVYIFFPFIQH